MSRRRNARAIRPIGAPDLDQKKQERRREIRRVLKFIFFGFLFR